METIFGIFWLTAPYLAVFAIIMVLDWMGLPTF